ncbi:MAG: hypothetical protein AB9873_18690 [Syntrophobacteraceae bacterium]
MPPRPIPSQPSHWILAAGAALLVYVIAHWPALTNPYVINDDVRQQIFWMQRWNDPEIYQNDLLCRYAESYVPWGVQAVYYAASWVMNPVQFTKVVSGVLFVVTALLLYGLGLRFGNNRAAFAVVCAFFFFTTFLRKISGGIAQSFAFPLLLAYLFFLARRNLPGCAVTIFVQSLFNPYIFLLSLLTHTLFLIRAYGRPVVVELFARVAGRGDDRATRGGLPSAAIRGVSWTETASSGLWSLVVVNLPILAGGLLMALKYVFMKSPELGELLTRSAMEGQVEYTSAGRYGFIPQTSFLYEVVRPWFFVFPVEDCAPAVGWAALAAVAALVLVAFSRTGKHVDLSGFRPFVYLLPASLILYFISSWVFMKLFIPRRYVEFSLNIFYCMVIAIAVSIIMESYPSFRKAFPGIVLFCVILGGARNYHVGIYDYSSDVRTYEFVETMPKTIMVAGPPDFMDNCLTFSRRKALITYELSHTWMSEYWSVVKQRTYDFFDAYYSASPAEVRNFASKYGVDYLIVREMDFTPPYLEGDRIYFEPFGSHVRREVGSRSSFSVLDSKAFPIVYQEGGIRILKLSP